MDSRENNGNTGLTSRWETDTLHKSTGWFQCLRADANGLGIGGGEADIPHGGSHTIIFYVSEGPTSAKIHQVFDGLTLRVAER